MQDCHKPTGVGDREVVNKQHVGDGRVAIEHLKLHLVMRRLRASGVIFGVQCEKRAKLADRRGMWMRIVVRVYSKCH